MNNKHIVVFGKLWFQKNYGNTYHSVKVWVNGKLIGEKSFTYGYWNAYEQTALGILYDAKIYQKIEKSPGLNFTLRQVVKDENNNNTLISEFANVSRKQDL